MAKRVFLSFVEEDLDLVNLFRGQAKNKNSDLEFADYSVKEPYDSTNAAYIRSRIRTKITAASVTLCLIGETTHKSKWVDWEVRESHSTGSKVLGVRLHSDLARDVAPKALTDVTAPIYNWNITDIVEAIG